MLFLEAFLMTGVVRMTILLLPFRWLAAVLGKQRRELPVKEDAIKLAAARRIGAVIETVSHYTPWESKCLVQASVGKFMLRRRGISNSLYLGVRRDKEKALAAHAWLQCGDVIINGGDGREAFTVVGQFVDEGDADRSLGKEVKK